MMKNLVTALLLIAISNLNGCHALSTGGVSRRQWLSQGSVAAGAIGAAFVVGASSPSPVAATDTTTKLTNLSNEDFTKILEKDITDNQFLVTGKISREIYDESATFQDEIDTYGMDQWIVGTGRLFVGDRSSLRLVGPVTVNDNEASFKFDEDLMFNIPLKPVVHLTGTLYLKRDPSTGLITSYKEVWDQGVWDVLKSAKI